MQKILGVVGGMGPLASAAFLETIYRLHLAEPEQGSPRVVMISDPAVPDRTEAILERDRGALVAGLTRVLEQAVAAGAERIVLACVTAHQVLSEVPESLRERVVSLLDLMADELVRRRRVHLLLATSGTRETRLFESHPRWSEMAPWLRQVPAEAQREVHEKLYQLKTGAPPIAYLPWLDETVARFGPVDGVVFGCTELHLLQRPLAERGAPAFAVLDPLELAARKVPELVEA